ncbi:TPA: hypothetical protein ACKQHQ_002940 [Pseudomonas aeruginosa]
MSAALKKQVFDFKTQYGGGASTGLATVAAGTALQPFKTLFIWEVCR